MKKIQQLKYAVLCFSIICSIVGCDKILDADSDLGLKEEDHYNTPDEVYAAFIGIQSMLQQTADQTIILSELRGDLLQPTQNASENFWNIYRYKANAGEYATSRPYYDIVIHCNDFIQHLFIYLDKNPNNIPDAVRDGMVSATINSKVWATMMVGKFFGEARFFESSMDEIVDDSLLPKYTLTALPDVLLAYMKQGENGIDAYNPLDWKLILSPLTEIPEWAVTHFRAEVIEGELLLWAGRYQEAADVFMNFVSNPLIVDQYKVNNKWAGENWSNLFISDYSELGEEVITGIPFDRLMQQQSKLQYYFSAQSPNVHYLNPTDVAMELFENQVRIDGSGDLIRSAASFGEENGVSIVSKYHLDEEKDEFDSDANVHIYRAADVHLMLAEAYCFLGEYAAALAFVNNGILTFFDNGINDFKPPFTGVDASMKNNSKGIRGRANLAAIELDEILKADMDSQDSLKTIAAIIADEVALELAYEGKRWFTLVRMARNLQNTDFLAEPVSLKFSEGEQNHWRDFLKVEQNWFVK